MMFGTHAIPALAAMAICTGATAANTTYRCTDASGLVLLTSDARAAQICKIMSAGSRKCGDESCAIRILKGQDGHLYINGTVNGTRVRYPVDTAASAVTICIRGQCKAQQ